MVQVSLSQQPGHKRRTYFKARSKRTKTRGVNASWIIMLTTGSLHNAATRLTSLYNQTS